jgi:hypothetical protein
MGKNLFFADIKFVTDDNNELGPVTEYEFYDWLRSNSTENIRFISSLKYRVGSDNYYFRVERSKMPILNKWDAFDAYPKSDNELLSFSFDWKRGLDFRLDFERKLSEGLENLDQNPLCVCKQEKRKAEFEDRKVSAGN